MSIKKGRSFMLFLGFLSLFPGLRAELAVSVSPMRLEYDFSRGNVISDTISVSNTGDRALRVKVIIRDWNLDLSGTPFFYPPEAGPFSCSAWIDVNPVDFRLGAGQTRNVRFSVNVPDPVVERGYRSALVFEFIPDVAPGQGRQIQFKSQIVTVIYGVAGRPLVRGEIIRLDATVQKENLQFQLLLKNNGLVHFRTKGTLKVKNGAGKVVLEKELPESPVLPGSERILSITVPKTLPRGKYTVTTLADIGLKEILGSETQFSIQ